MATRDDTQEQLNDLEEEEQRIIRELHDLEERARADEHVKHRHEHTIRDDPASTLTSLLLECEKEVRDAKGFISDHGPPLTIVRVRTGESAPKGATYLSRPKNTGVDFTVPLTTRDYTSVVKRPMFLNTIRDKIKAHSYSSSEDYLEDMRLLARNTAAFNKGPELSWVVQHATLLLEAAEDAVTTRRRQFYEIEDAVRHVSPSKHRAAAATPSSAGKRKRSSQNPATVETANGDTKLPSVGQSIDVYWPNYRRWFTASVVGKSGANVHVVYDEDSTDQWIDLQSTVKWRTRNVRAAAASTKSRRGQEQPASKRRKGSASAPAATADNPPAPIHVPSGPGAQDLDNLRNDLVEKLHEISGNVKIQLKEHLERVDRLLLRSDHLERVLLAVEDSRESNEARIGRVEAWQSRIDDKLEKILQQVQETLKKPLAEVAAKKETTKENGGPTGEEGETDQEEGAGNEKQEAENSTVPNEVIVVDNSSSEKQNSTTGDIGEAGLDDPKRPIVEMQEDKDSRVAGEKEKSKGPEEKSKTEKVDHEPVEECKSAAAGDENPAQPAEEEQRSPAENQPKATEQASGGSSPVAMEVASPVNSPAKEDRSKAPQSETRDERKNEAQESDGHEPQDSILKEADGAKKHGKAQVGSVAGKSVIKQENDASKLTIGAVDDEESSDESDGSDDSDSDSSSSGDDAMKLERGPRKEGEKVDKPSSRETVRDDKGGEKANAGDGVREDVIGNSDGKDVDKVALEEGREKGKGDEKVVDGEEEKSSKA